MISQTLSTFVESGWVEQSNEDESYALTPIGKRVLVRYEQLKETVDWVTAHASEINSLGEIGPTLPARSIAQSRDRVEVIEATASNPDKALNHYADRVAECEPERIRGIVPMVSSLSNQIHIPLLEQGVSIEIVITEPAYKSAQSAYPEMIKSAATSELFDLYVYPERLTFAVAILEDCQRAIVSGQGEMGVAKFCFDSPIEPFVDWARTLFQNYRSAATSAQKLP